MKKSILIISALLMLYSCNNQAAEGVAAIEKGWSKRTIKVEEGKATVMNLLKAFNKVWHTAAADSIFAVADGKECFMEEWYAGKSPVFVDNEDFCTAWYNHGDTGEQQLDARTYQRTNGHFLFAVRVEQNNPEHKLFCCFYDYDPESKTLTPEDAPYKDIKRKWENSFFDYHLGNNYDQTVIVEEINKEGGACFHHFVWNGLKHEFDHSGDETYANEGDPEGYPDEDQKIISAPASEWTEEAVEKRIREYFDAVNKTFAEGSTMSPFDLDKQYYSSYWNEVYGKVNAKDSKQTSAENCFFVDDNHWTAGLETPVEVKDIKVQLLSGDMAEATLTLAEKVGGFKKKVVLNMDYGQLKWDINDWIDLSMSKEGSSLLSQMEKYIR